MLLYLLINLCGKVVDDIMHTSAHGTAGRTDMSAAAKIRCDLTHIYKVVGAHTYLVYMIFRLMQEDGHFHAIGYPELVYNAVIQNA